MHHLIIVFLATFLPHLTLLSLTPGSSTSSGLVLAQSSNPIPCVVYTCPPADVSEGPLVTSFIDGDMLECIYVFGGTDFQCFYDTTTGILEIDHDEGFCPLNATPTIVTCSTKRSFERSLQDEAMKRDRTISSETVELQKARRSLMKRKDGFGNELRERTQIDFGAE